MRSNILVVRDAHLSELSRASLSIHDASQAQEMNKRIWTGAFGSHFAHPVVLFHEALALLQRRIDMLDSQAKTGYDWPKPNSEPEPLSASLLSWSAKYFDDCRAPYDDEDALATKLVSTLDLVIGITGSSEKYSSTTMDDKRKGSFMKGDNRVDFSWGPFHHIIADFKLLFGQEGDATAQGGLRYGKTCNEVKVRVIVSSGFSMLIYRMRIGRCKVQV